MDPREGRGCCLLTSPSLGYNVTGLVAGAALGTRGSCDGIAVGNSKYKTGEINSVCVSFCGVGDHGHWVGALLRVGQARWSNQESVQTLLQHIHTYTCGEGRAPGHRVDGNREGWQLVTWLSPQPPLR